AGGALHCPRHHQRPDAGPRSERSRGRRDHGPGVGAGGAAGRDDSVLADRGADAGRPAPDLAGRAGRARRRIRRPRGGAPGTGRGNEMTDSTIGIERIGPARRRALVLLVLAGAGLAATAEAAQVRTTSSTGLFTLPEGHSATLTLVETGGSAAGPSAVVLELLGAADQVLARQSAQLRPGHPVQLRLESPRDVGERIRARARVTTGDANRAS